MESYICVGSSLAEHFETNHVLCKRKRREVYKFPPIQMEFL